MILQNQTKKLSGNGTKNVLLAVSFHGHEWSISVKRQPADRTFPEKLTHCLVSNLNDSFLDYNVLFQATIGRK